MSSPPRSRLDRWYRRLLSLLPFEFRADFADEMAAVFRAERRDAGRAGTRARLAFAGRILVDAIRTIPREHSDVFLRDITQAWRTMARSPVLTVVALLTLALGIGATTAIFTLVDAVLLKRLPVDRPEALVQLVTTTPRDRRQVFPFPMFARLRDQRPGTLAAFYDVGEVRISLHGETTVAPALLVSGNYFTLLGVRAAAGRLIEPDDDEVSRGSVATRASIGPVVVLSDRFWQQRFGRRPSVVGELLLINGKPFTIVGIAPPGFLGTQVGGASDLFAPLGAGLAPGLKKNDNIFTNDRMSWLQIFGRLPPDVPIERLRAELDAMLRAMRVDLAGRIDDERRAQAVLAERLDIVSARTGTASGVRDRFAEPLLILLAAVGLVLIIACGNLANLLLARGAARRRELAVRQSLGARPLRLFRQLLTESLVLALAGGALGLLLAWWGTQWLLALVSSGRSPVSLDVAPDARLLWFTFGLSVLTGVLFGLAPAMAAMRVDPAGSLSQRSRSSAHALAGTRTGKALVVAQVALSLLPVVGAALFARTLHNLRGLDVGYAREGLVVGTFDPRLAGYGGTRLTDLGERLLAHVRALPGVRAASLSMYAPLEGDSWSCGIRAPGYAPPQGEESWVYCNIVSADFFTALGVPLLRGRGFGPQDRDGTRRVAIVNLAMARQFFGGADPVGRVVTPGSSGEPTEIIGLVKDVTFDELRGQPGAVVYTPYLQTPAPLALKSLNLMVRTASSTEAAEAHDSRSTGALPGGGRAPVVTPSVPSPIDAAALVEPMRRAIRAADPDLPVLRVETLAQRVDAVLVQERLVTRLSGLFALLALVLSAIGLYGTMTYAVAGRTSEIGLRVALGAERRQVFWLILGDGARLVLTGLAIGLPLALASVRVVAAWLFGITPADPPAIAAAVGVTLAVTMIAGYLPARHALRIDPLRALRVE